MSAVMLLAGAPASAFVGADDQYGTDPGPSACFRRLIDPALLPPDPLVVTDACVKPA